MQGGIAVHRGGQQPPEEQVGAVRADRGAEWQTQVHQCEGGGGGPAGAPLLPQEQEQGAVDGGAWGWPVQWGAGTQVGTSSIIELQLTTFLLDQFLQSKTVHNCLKQV